MASDTFKTTLGMELAGAGFRTVFVGGSSNITGWSLQVWSTLPEVDTVLAQFACINDVGMWCVMFSHHISNRPLASL